MGKVDTTCVIAGGGPAGLMLGYLLARAGVKVCVLEKHEDFLRDFRGDTIHPSTMEALHDLGDLDDFLKLPHSTFRRMSFDFEGREVGVADFTTLDLAAPYVAMMPQWDFLDFLADRARGWPGFDLRMRTEAKSLLEESGRIVGVRAEGPEGEVEIRADLVVAADGRGSVLRAAAGLAVEEFGAPIDVLWFRLSRQPGDDPESLGRLRHGRLIVMLNRGYFWQCAQVVPKGGAARVKAEGLAAFRAHVDETTGLTPPRGGEIASLDEVKLLNVQVNRAKRWWREGFLAIGDAAHAMSPLGGVGVNMAIQDAVAAANLLHGPLARGGVTGAELARVEAERVRAVRIVQRLQVVMAERMIAPLISGKRFGVPLPLRVLGWMPWLQRFPARLIGQGIGMERVAPEIVGGSRGQTP